jgi:hydroxyacylglutathione hydrolase
MYFARMKRDNKLGAPVLGKLPQPQKLTVSELHDAADSDETLIIDTRIDRSAFMEHHIPGSLYAPMNKTFNTVVGSLVVDETTPLVLIIDEDDVEEAVRDLVRIGYDNVMGFATPETQQRFFAKGGPSESVDEIDFADLETLRDEPNTQVVDVRFRSEYDEAHVPNALNASYTRLPEYEEKIPTDKTLIVHCGSGARAAAATAFLRRTGRTVKYVNDDFSNYASSKEPVTA